MERDIQLNTSNFVPDLAQPKQIDTPVAIARTDFVRTIDQRVSLLERTPQSERMYLEDVEKVTSDIVTFRDAFLVTILVQHAKENTNEPGMTTVQLRNAMNAKLGISEENAHLSQIYITNDTIDTITESMQHVLVRMDSSTSVRNPTKSITRKKRKVAIASEWMSKVETYLNFYLNFVETYPSFPFELFLNRKKNGVKGKHQLSLKLEVAWELGQLLQHSNQASIKKTMLQKEHDVNDVTMQHTMKLLAESGICSLEECHQSDSDYYYKLTRAGIEAVYQNSLIYNSPLLKDIFNLLFQKQSQDITRMYSRQELIHMLKGEYPDTYGKRYSDKQKELYDTNQIGLLLQQLLEGQRSDPVIEMYERATRLHVKAGTHESNALLEVTRFLTGANSEYGYVPIPSVSGSNSLLQKIYTNGSSAELQEYWKQSQIYEPRAHNQLRKVLLNQVLDEVQKANVITINGLTDIIGKSYANVWELVNILYKKGQIVRERIPKRNDLQGVEYSLRLPTQYENLQLVFMSLLSQSGIVSISQSGNASFYIDSSSGLTSMLSLDDNLQKRYTSSRNVFEEVTLATGERVYILNSSPDIPSNDYYQLLNQMKDELLNITGNDVFNNMAFLSTGIPTPPINNPKTLNQAINTKILTSQSNATLGEGKIKLSEKSIKRLQELSLAMQLINQPQNIMSTYLGTVPIEDAVGAYRLLLQSEKKAGIPPSKYSSIATAPLFERIYSLSLPTLDRVARKYIHQLKGLEYDEIMAKLNERLLSLLMKYDREKGPYSHYLYARLEFYLIDMLRKETHYNRSQNLAKEKRTTIIVSLDQYIAGGPEDIYENGHRSVGSQLQSPENIEKVVINSSVIRDGRLVLGTLKEKLGERDTEIVRLFFEEGLRMNKIATIFDLSPAMIGNIITKAKSILQELLVED